MEFARQLKLVYEKLCNVSLEINTAIQKQHYHDFPALISRKEQLLKYLKQMHKQNKDYKLTQDILVLKNKLEEQELKNIELFKTIKDGVKQELERVIKDAKFQSAYSQHEMESVIVDIRE